MLTETRAFLKKILCVFITVLYTQTISVCLFVFVGSSATSILNCLQILAQSLDIRWGSSVVLRMWLKWGLEGFLSKWRNSRFSIPQFMNEWDMKNTCSTQQDSDEDRLRVGEGRALVVLQLCCRRSGEDSSESQTGSVHPQHSAGTGRGSRHQLHHLRSAARAVLPLWAHWPEHVRTRPNTYVLTVVSVLNFQWVNAFIYLRLFSFYFENLLFQWMMFKSPVTESSTVFTFWEPMKASMLKGMREHFQSNHCFCLMLIIACPSVL